MTGIELIAGLRPPRKAGGGAETEMPLLSTDEEDEEGR